MSDGTPAPSLQALNLSPINIALENIAANFDIENGGFGDAPKFPHTNYLELLLYFYVMSHDDALLTMISTSLIKMAEGGVYDQIGGSFFVILLMLHGKSRILKKCYMITLYYYLFMSKLTR